MSTYRDNLEAENLKLKAQLLAAITELDKLKEKNLPTPEQVIKDLTPVLLVEEDAERKFKSILYSPPSRITYGHDSFLNHFRSPSSELKLRVGLVSATIVLILAIFSS